MQPVAKQPPSAISIGRTGILMPAILAFVLLAILFPMPQPSIPVGQPFKIELLVSLFLMAFFVVMHRQNADKPRYCGHDLSVIAIGCSIGTFVLWSAASVFWGASFASVAHHTLLWSIYLTFFLIFTGSLWTDGNFRFVTNTFVLIGLILGLLCIFDYFTSDFASSEGVLRVRYGKYAELLVTISPLLWVLAIYIRDRARMLPAFLAAILSWVTVMLSLSKGAFIAGIVGFVIFFIGSALFASKVFRKRVVALAAIWLAVTVGTQVFFSWFSAVPSTTSYITGTADASRSTATMRVFTWKVARQMAADHWLTGVGADNFGLAFNGERSLYRKDHPDDPKVEIAEDYLVERAHNEPLQVLSELGVVGLSIFALPIAIFGFYFLRTFWRRRFRLPPVLWAAVAGMAGFVISSGFSSFSFRAAQNGIVFFMVFAVAITKLAKISGRTRETPSSGVLWRRAYLLGWLFTVLMAVFCVTKVVAEYDMYKAENSDAYSEAQNHFRSAIAIDPEYAGAYLSIAGRASGAYDPDPAAAWTRKAIDLGLGVTVSYSQLAKRLAAAGDVAAAEATFREAIAIYPRSIFIRTEFVVFLEEHGRADAAAEQVAIARSIDPRQANGWYAIIKHGSVAAFYASNNDQEIAPPADLIPYNGVVQYVDKFPGMAPVEEKSR